MKGVPAYGYRHGEEKTLALILSLSRGMNNCEVARVLNERILLTRDGWPWRHSTIARILEREKGKHERIRSCDPAA